MNTTKNTKFMIVSIMTIISILLFTLTIIINAILPFWFMMPYCLWSTSLAAAIYGFAKVFMYLVFFMKLDLVYETTLYEYNKTYLKLFSALIILITIIVMPFHFLTWNIDPFFYKQGISNNIAIKCNTTYNSLTAGVLALIDLVCSIGFMIAFIRPLQKISKQVDSSKAKNNDLMRVGMKTMILTGSACMSSLTLLILLVSYTVVGTLFAGPDAIINVISLMLMSSYYHDKKYFDKICCCCIKIMMRSFGDYVNDGIDASRVRTKSTTSNETATASPTSMVSMSSSGGIEIVTTEK